MKSEKLCIIALCALALVLSGCNKDYRYGAGENYSKVLILFSEGYNNLCDELETNLDALCTGDLPQKDENKAIVVFSHIAAGKYNYNTPTNPVIYRIYKNKKGTAVRDTIKVFSENTVSASSETFSNALTFIEGRFPSDHYGLVYSSHATGWIPAGYNSNTEGDIIVFSVGAQFETNNYEAHQIDFIDFVQAIPIHLDYIIFDACLMGSIECVYQLRKKCDYFVASPTEILTGGLVYSTMPQRLLNSGDPDLEGLCADYYAAYENRSATIALVDCGHLTNLALTCRKIYDKHSGGLEGINKGDVQSYNYSLGKWFYDLKDVCRAIGATEAELQDLQEALDEAVLYKAATPYFLGLKIDPEKFCGLSTYLYDSNWPKLNEYYKTLDWNGISKYVE